jgi:hypothetical protein
MALARFYACVIQGTSQQARDGATAEELLDVATTAMAAWPRTARAAVPQLTITHASASGGTRPGVGR